MSSERPSGEMTPAGFIAKWSRVALTERAASQEHFIDLCRLLGQPTPAQHDATGAEYTFEKGVSVTGGASRGAKGDGGYADAWWRGRFAWEYKRKGKYKDLADAYRQLCQYREALENPPLLVVCDITRTEIHTNFTGTAKQVHHVALADLDKPESLSLLRRVFTDPKSFCPTVTPEKVTEEVAKSIASLAGKLRARGHDPHATAHFLMKCMFCLFAEDVRLLPDKLFSRLLSQWHDQPAELTARFTELFDRMRTGGPFGSERIAWFNGGLFDASPALPLEFDEIGLLQIAASQDWGSVEPAIFGTLFERSLDPTKRAQIGAHYTGRDDIMLIVEPVVMAPLRREWQAVREKCRPLLEERAAAARRREKLTRDKGDHAPQWYTGRVEKLLAGFLHRLASLRILDPACGSGNFLYVAIQQLLDLEKEVITFAAQCGLGLFPTVRPTQLHGIEINPYAAELAQVVIWIGYLQWMRDNGFNAPRDPILQPLQTIENRDAILDRGEGVSPLRPAGVPPAVAVVSSSVPQSQQSPSARPAFWPDADFIIGNPPFLGDKLMRRGLGDEYVTSLRSIYEARIPGGADLCTYWFELARERIKEGCAKRAGLLATQNIRGGANRKVLDRIKESGDIFMAVSDRDWVLDGASVHISMVGFDDGTEKARMLDGTPVTEIHSNLSAGSDAAQAKPLQENQSIAFLGSCKGGPFDITFDEARRLLAVAGNPNGRPNSDVLRPVVNSQDLLGRTEPRWIIDNANKELSEACLYGGPHAIVETMVKPRRDKNRDQWLRDNWWRPQRMRPEMRDAIAPLTRFVVTPTTSKHRVFAWMGHPVLPDHQLIVFARSDDYSFGVLHSAIDELWARHTGTQLREAESGFRYTPTTCFETFPLPWPPGQEPLECGDKVAALACAGNAKAGPHSPIEGKAASQPPHSIEEPSGGPMVAQPFQAVQAQAGKPVPPPQLHAAISRAAKELDEMRQRWLNPPEWIEPIARAVDAEDDFADVPAEARALIRQSAILAAAARDPNLKKRTLTNLYNERPTWLRLCHRKLDQAVLAAYAAVDPAGAWSADWADAWLDSGAGRPLPADHPLAARRAEIDQKVLANLLRLNRERAAKPAAP